MEPTCGTGLNSGTSLNKLTSSPAEESIERIIGIVGGRTNKKARS